MFLATGGVAAVANFCSRLIYNMWTSFSIAIILAFITGLSIAFVLARLLVFKDSQKPAQNAALKFLVVNLVAVVLTWVISMGMAYYALPALSVTSFVYEIAHATGIIFPVFTSYLAHKYWSFA